MLERVISACCLLCLVRHRFNTSDMRCEEEQKKHPRGERTEVLLHTFSF